MDKDLGLGYYYTKAWFAFAFSNPDKVKPVHGILYLWQVEQNNINNWSKVFTSPAEKAMNACGIKNFHTYSNALRDLISWGFIKLVKASTNQYTACIIALLKNDRASNKATAEQATKQQQSTPQSTPRGIDSYIKPKNNKTLKTLSSEPDSEFETFWDGYGKKTDRSKCIRAWAKISPEDKAKIWAVLPAYVASTPELKYRKNPLTWLNGECWNDEVKPPPVARTDTPAVMPFNIFDTSNRA